MKKIVIVFYCILLAACSNKKAETPKEEISTTENKLTLTQPQLKNAALSYGKLEQKEISSIIKLNGKIDVPPQSMVSVSVPMGGYLKTTKLLPGMQINKGDVIAVIEDQQYIQLQEDYLLTQSKIIYKELEYNRQKELNLSKASSDKVLEQAIADLNSLKITRSALVEKLKLIAKNPAKINLNNISRSINIYSPINGFVSKVNVNIGKYVSPTDVLFELVNPADIHLALNVFEKDLPKLFIGQKLIAYTNHNPKKRYSCEVLLIGKNLGSEGATEVHCHFEAYDKTLVPGTYMNAELEIKLNNSFVLPDEAVVSFENKHYVFIKMSALTFDMVEVQTGDTENGFIAILNGKEFAQHTFVIKGAYTLLMSLKNKPEEE